MPSNQTPNYQLSQWEAGDRVQRADFNADNAKIDAVIKAVDIRVESLAEQKADVTALASKTEIVTGSYNGDDASTRFLNLGFTPKAVLVMTSFGSAYDSTNGMRACFGGLALPGLPLTRDNHICIQIVENGIRLHHSVVGDNPTLYYSTNLNGMTYYYLAFK